jgi:hypothetical protein
MSRMADVTTVMFYMATIITRAATWRDARDAVASLLLVDVWMTKE